MNIYNWQVQTETKIICEKLKNNEKISYDDWIIDASYFRWETSEFIKFGYGFWSKPVLNLMIKNKKIEKLVTCLAQWLIEDIKYKKKLNKKLHKRGFFLRYFFFNPFSWLLGCLAWAVLKIRIIKQMSTTVL